MMRGTTLILAGAALCASFAFADGQKSTQLEAVDASQIRTISPKRIMRVRMENGKIVPLTSWIDMGDFAPAGPCDTTGQSETLVFSHAPVNANTGAFENGVQVCIQGGIFWFGPTDHNPYYANDIASLSDASFNGGQITSLTHLWGWNPDRVEGNGDTQNCVIAIFTTEQFDAECQDVHEDSQQVLDGVLIDYGLTAEGIYISSVCLTGVEIPMPSTVADDGTPGTELLGGYTVIYGQSVDTAGTITLATGAQPMLWHNRLNNPQIGDSTAIQFDDTNTTDGNHNSPNPECYSYSYDLSSFGCPNPSLLGGTIAFWATPSCVQNGGDVDGNGCVDDADLLAVLFAFGSTGSGLPEDTNCDQVVDDADLLEVLFNFGNGC